MTCLHQNWSQNSVGHICFGRSPHGDTAAINVPAFETDWNEIKVPLVAKSEFFTDFFKTAYDRIK